MAGLAGEVTQLLHGVWCVVCDEEPYAAVRTVFVGGMLRLKWITRNIGIKLVVGCGLVVTGDSLALDEGSRKSPGLR